MNKYMSMNDIMDFIEEMSMSQGLYGRLLLQILELKEYDEDGYNDLVEEWTDRFTSPLDFVLYIEC